MIKNKFYVLVCTQWKQNYKNETIHGLSFLLIWKVGRSSCFWFYHLKWYQWFSRRYVSTISLYYSPRPRLAPNMQWGRTGAGISTGKGKKSQESSHYNHGNQIYRIHWRLLTILQRRTKSTQSNVFRYVKVNIF